MTIKLFSVRPTLSYWTWVTSIYYKFSITAYCSAGALPLEAWPFPAELLGVVVGDEVIAGDCVMAIEGWLLAGLTCCAIATARALESAWIPWASISLGPLDLVHLHTCWHVSHVIMIAEISVLSHCLRCVEYSIYMWSTAFTYGVYSIYVQSTVFAYMECYIYIQSTVFAYGVLHIYMEHCSYIWSAPFICGAQHLHIVTYGVLHMHTEHCICIGSAPYVYGAL